MNLNKKVVFNEEVLTKLLEGIEILSNAVSSTLGPKGRNVIIEEQFRTPTVTKDGVTVSKHINLEDPLQNLGVNIVKQAAAKTADLAGDGTTTATLLSYALIKEYLPLLSTHAPIDIKRAIDNYSSQVIEFVRSKSNPVTLDDVFNIASISSNNDPEIGQLIKRAYEEVGMEGMIAVEESRTPATHLTLTEGVSFDRGYLSPYFITDKKAREAVLDNPYILITDKKLRSIDEILPLIELVAKAGRSLLIIADSVEGQVLHTLALNATSGRFPSCAVNAPSYGDNRADILGDLAIITSAEIISDVKAQRLQDVTLSQLGTASKVIIRKDETVLVGTKPNKEELENRVILIKNLIEENQSENYVREKLYQRLSSLIAKVCTLNVGAATETEMREKKDRIDDALRATRAAIALGYVPGAGSIFMEASTMFPDEPLALPFIKALQYPLHKIASNAGVNADDVIKHILTGYKDIKSFTYIPNFGFNAKTEKFVDLVTDGVIDPTLVVEQTMINAASAASMILLSSTAIYNVDRTPPYSPQGMYE